MTTLRQAIADNLILDPETGEWSGGLVIGVDPAGPDGGATIIWRRNDRGGLDIESWTYHPEKERAEVVRINAHAIEERHRRQKEQTVSDRSP